MVIDGKVNFQGEKMMKKLLVLVLVLSLTLCMFAGCGDDSKDPGTDAPEKIKVAHFVFDFGDTQQSLVKGEMQKLYDGAGYDVTFYDGAGNQATQSDQISSALLKDINLIVVGMKDASAAQNIADMAKEADIPLVFYNAPPQPISVIDSYDPCWFVGTDVRGGGVGQGEIAAEFILNDFAKWDRNGDGKIQYIMIEADPAQPEAVGRTEAAPEVLDEMLKAAGKAGVEQLGENYMAEDWSAALGKDRMSTALTKFPLTETSGPEVIFGNNDGIAFGALSAVQEAGWNKGGVDELFVPILGVDGTSDVCAAIDAEQMLGTASQPADKMAAYVFSVVKCAAEGTDPVANCGYDFNEGTKRLDMPYGKIVID